ncbi:Alpha subunit of chaperonin-containing T-complex [Balamuthia mandrillaris]
MKVTPLAIDGNRQSGQDVRTQNVTACLAIANIVRSSFGPVGLDKMMVDDIGDVTISNDGATILKLLDVEHPAAKILVDLADLQDKEVGDGTTSVVILAAEFLKRANELVKNKIHPTSVISGFRLASREASKFISEHLAIGVEAVGRDCLLNAAKTSLSSKIIGAESDFFADIIVKAVTRVKTVDPKGEIKYPIKAINVLKSQGKSTKESMFIEGFALNCTVASQAMPKYIKNAKIAILDINLAKQKMSLGVTVSVSDPAKMEAIVKKETDLVKEKIELILKAGANVVLTTKGIDDTCLKYFVEAGAMAVRRCKKEDLRHIARATGATMLVSLADLEGGEAFDASMLGHADEVVQERLADHELILIKGCKTSRTASLILRGPSSFMLDEVERSVHDAICIVKRVLESKAVVPGGGAVEAALSIYLEEFATTLGSREQLAIAEFAEALLVIPKTLAVNAAQDATDLVAKLRAYHNTAQKNEKKRDYSMSGLDLEKGCIRNNLKAGVLEPAMSKIKCIQSATEAAITILRIDDLVKLNPRQEPNREDEGY